MPAPRYVVDRFTQGDHADVNGMESAFQKMMDDMIARACELTETVAEVAFSVAYQPIADLNTGQVTRYEALTRFAEPAMRASGGVCKTLWNLGRLRPHGRGQDCLSG